MISRDIRDSDGLGKVTVSSNEINQYKPTLFVSININKKFPNLLKCSVDIKKNFFTRNLDFSSVIHFLSFYHKESSQIIN